MTIDNELIDNLLKDYKKPEDIIGENGLLKQLTKQLLERAMAAEMTEHGLGFLTSHHHRQPFRLPRPDDLAEVADLTGKDVAIQEQQGGEGLVLRRGADLVLDCQMREKGVDLAFRHLRRMA